MVRFLYSSLSLILCLLSVFFPCSVPVSGSPISTLHSLHHSIQHERINSSHVKSFPFLREGLYNSIIKVNIANSSLSSLSRAFGCLDNNFFATSYVLQLYFEVYEHIHMNTTLFNAIPLSDSLFLPSIQQLSSPIFHDNNGMIRQSNSTGIIQFWPSKFNATFGEFLQAPENLNAILGLVDSPFMQGILKWVEKTFPALKPFIEFLMYFSGSEWPMIADFDDTALNLVLGANLQRFQSVFPQSHQAWTQPTFNAQWANTFQLYYQYRYDPFSDSDDLNRIVSSSYFWLRDFLWQQYRAQNSSGSTPSLALITVWIANETSLIDWNRQIGRPEPKHSWAPGPYWWPDFNQVIDGTVTSNAMIGILSALFANSQSYQSIITPATIQLLRDNFNLLSYILQENWAIKRPDLVCVYYPNLYNFYHFASRAYQLMYSNDLTQFKSNPQLYQVLVDGLQTLQTSFQGQGTTALLSKLIVSPTNSDQAYWQDFLGESDLPKPHPADRIYSTAMAVNALLNIWTTGLGPKYVWLANTPPAVVDAARKALNYLELHVLENPILSDEYDGTFFSGMNKGPSTWIPSYPNRPGKLHYHGPNTTYLFDFGVSGMWNEADYEAELQRLNSPTEPTLNDPNQIWPWWGSLAFTQSNALLALVKQTLLQNNGQL